MALARFSSDEDAIGLRCVSLGDDMFSRNGTFSHNRPSYTVWQWMQTRRTLRNDVISHLSAAAPRFRLSSSFALVELSCKLFVSWHR